MSKSSKRRKPSNYVRKTRQSELYIVEQLKDHQRLEDGEYRYFIKWQNYPDSDNTWQPQEDILDKSLIEDYWRTWAAGIEDAARMGKFVLASSSPIENTPLDPSQNSQDLRDIIEVTDLVQYPDSRVYLRVTHRDESQSYQELDFMHKRYPLMMCEWYHSRMYFTREENTPEDDECMGKPANDENKSQVKSQTDQIMIDSQAPSTPKSLVNSSTSFVLDTP